MRLRIARHTNRLEEVVAFYRDRAGFPELGQFTGHDGYDASTWTFQGPAHASQFTTGGELGAPRPRRIASRPLLDTQEELAEASQRSGRATPIP